MTPLRWVLATVLLLLAASCGGSGDGDDADSGTEREVPAPEVLVGEAADRLAAASSFSFSLRHEAGATVVLDDIDVTEADGVVVAPDRFSADLVAEVVGQRVELGAIAIGETVWLTNPFDRESWAVVPGVTIAELLDLTQLPATLDAVVDLTADGTETIDGVLHDRVVGEIASADLVGVLPSSAEPGYTVGVELSVAVDTPTRIGRLVLSGPLSDADDPDVIRVLDVDDLGADVVIEPPE